jgi:hypothetical protein
VARAAAKGDPNAPAGNFFKTTLAHGTYQPGFSAADVAGAAYVAPGAAPQGANGAVNAADIDYIHANLRAKLIGQVAGQGSLAAPACYVRCIRMMWVDLNDAALMDLSCDLNNDLLVDNQDVDYLVHVILQTTYGDVDLDGDVDAADTAVFTANLNAGPGKGWAQGDMNGDGWVTAEDLDLDSCSYCGNAGGVLGDLDGDGDVDLADFAIFSQNWLY